MTIGKSPAAHSVGNTEFIEDLMLDHGKLETVLQDIGMSEEEYNIIVDGRIRLAELLGKRFDTSTGMWLNIMSNNDMYRVREKEFNQSQTN